MSIVLNISGKIFHVPKDVLCRSPLFNNMINDSEIDSVVVIERSSSLFKHVYAYLLDPQYPYPAKYRSELDYYLIEYDAEKLYDPYAELKREMNILREEIQEIKDILEDEVVKRGNCSQYYCDSQRARGSEYCECHSR